MDPELSISSICSEADSVSHQRTAERLAALDETMQLQIRGSTELAQQLEGNALPQLQQLAEKLQLKAVLEGYKN